jgi:8-oxo-dGTP diphosphatase
VSVLALDRFYRIGYFVGFRLALQWWRIWRPQHRGALVAVWVRDRILLVRQSYRRGWTLPGGGVGYHEDPRHAAWRELAEEVGITAGREQLAVAFETSGVWDFRHDYVQIFELKLASEPELRIDNREIVAARFEPASAAAGLPLSPPVRRYLAALYGASPHPRPSPASGRGRRG